MSKVSRIAGIGWALLLALPHAMYVLVMTQGSVLGFVTSLTVNLLSLIFTTRCFTWLPQSGPQWGTALLVWALPWAAYTQIGHNLPLALTRQPNNGATIISISMTATVTLAAYGMVTGWATLNRMALYEERT